MCGRFGQSHEMQAYISKLECQLPLITGFEPGLLERYNVAPTSVTRIFRSSQEGMTIDPVKWGWEPFWAKGKRPPAINARAETVATSRFFKSLWLNGRSLVPASFWYEWVKSPDNPKKKQPYLIRLKGGAPMYFAALSQVHESTEPHPEDGFVIITAASDAGMVDIHDRRPLVFSPTDARRWLNPELEQSEAAEMVGQCCRPVDDFEWYPVGVAVVNVRNQGASLAEPVELSQ